MDIAQLFSDQTALTQEYIIEKIANVRRALTNNERRLINEALVAIDKVLDCKALQAHDRILLEKTYRYGHDAVYERLNYFANYYYSYQSISKGNIEKKQTAFLQINADTATMLTTILGFRRRICTIGGSTDDYYTERMPRVLWAIEYVYKHNLTEVYLPSLYVLINLCQSLSEYLLSDDQQYKTKASGLLINTELWLDKFTQTTIGQELLTENLQLNLFYKTQKNRIIGILRPREKAINITLDDLPNVKTEQKLRILTSIYHLNKKLFVPLFESNLNTIANDIYRSQTGLNNLLLLQCLAYYSQLKPFIHQLSLKLNPLSKNSVDIASNLKNLFNNYENAYNESISADELNILLSYNDNILREKLAKTILGVDRNILERERQKPHGSFEISDMEIQIRINGEKYFLCLPFKSGVEIRTTTVPVDVSYQIFRPFIHFNDPIVLFVTAKRCSQQLMNYIKLMQDKLGWSIAVLENEELAKLLKANGQLN